MRQEASRPSQSRIETQAFRDSRCGSHHTPLGTINLLLVVHVTFCSVLTAQPVNCLLPKGRSEDELDECLGGGHGHHDPVQRHQEGGPEQFSVPNQAATQQCQVGEEKITEGPTEEPEVVDGSRKDHLDEQRVSHKPDERHHPE